MIMLSELLWIIGIMYFWATLAVFVSFLDSDGLDYPDIEAFGRLLLLSFLWPIIGPALAIMFIMDYRENIGIFFKGIFFKKIRLKKLWNDLLDKLKIKDKK